MDEKWQTIRKCLSRLYCLTDEFNLCVYEQNISLMQEKSKDLVALLQDFYVKYWNDVCEFADEKQLEGILVPLCQAMESQDYIYMADIGVGSLKPFVESLLYILIVNFLAEDNAVRGRNGGIYATEWSNSGNPILRIEKNAQSFYLHSNINPFLEGEVFAKRHREEEISEYIVYGLGYGYHIRGLYENSPYIKIKVYESDKTVLEQFEKQAKEEVFVPEMNETTEIIYDPDFSLLLKELKNDNQGRALLMHYPSLRLIEDDKIKEKLENYLITYESIRRDLGLLNSNFRENTKGTFRTGKEVVEEFAGKEVVFIAGGPSLDGEMERLREKRDRYIVTAAGTVFKKLLNGGIVPDYIFMSDPKLNMVAQIKDTDMSKTTLIYLSTCNKEAVTYYEGKKYMLLQNGFEKAEMLAEEKGEMLVSTGGSVSTTAIGFFINAKCKRVICIGLDLAIPGGKSHASGTAFYKELDTKNSRMVKAVDGTKVPTMKNLDTYRIFIEKQITEPEGVEFINCSKGAYIQGMKHMEFEQV